MSGVMGATFYCLINHLRRLCLCSVQFCDMVLRRRSRVEHDHGAAAGVARETAVFGNHT